MKTCRAALGLLACAGVDQLQAAASFLRTAAPQPPPAPVTPGTPPVAAPAAAGSGLGHATGGGAAAGVRKMDASAGHAAEEDSGRAAEATGRVAEAIISRVAEDALAGRGSQAGAAERREGNASRAGTAVVNRKRGIAWWKQADAWNHWEFADKDAMFGYTDCSSQSPPVGQPQKNNAWWQAHYGHHSMGQGCMDCEGTVRVPQVSNFGFCPVQKNGCTYWKALFMRMDNNPLWNSTEIMDVHYRDRNKLDYDNTLLGHPGGLIVMTVRNPVTRLLSSWLDKRQDPLYLSWFADHPGTTMSFATFVETVAPDVASHTADNHWAQQSDLCRLNYGATYDMYLKVECRTLWAPALFEHKQMQTWTQSGWGPDGTEPFVKDDRKAMQYQNGPMRVAPSTDSKASIERVHNTGASALDEVCKYYTAELFWAVTLMYVADIRRFGYAEDCQRIAQHCHF